jgi:uncharacterized protein with FMN-binding domain
MMALFAVATGTALLVGLKSQQLAVPLGLATAEPAEPDGPAPSDGPVAGGPAATVGPTGSPGTTPAAGADPSAQTSAAAPDQVTTTAVEVPAINGTFTGQAIAVVTAQSPNTKSRPCGDCHDYSMSVTITVSNSQIVQATVSYSPDPGESQRYADKAANTLRPATLTAQAWRLGNVSGATYSANAYELSLRDAMTKAGLPA